MTVAKGLTLCILILSFVCFGQQTQAIPVNAAWTSESGYGATKLGAQAASPVSVNIQSRPLAAVVGRSSGKIGSATANGPFLPREQDMFAGIPSFDLPLPSGLTLFVSGLVGMGLLIHRRRTKLFLLPED